VFEVGQALEVFQAGVRDARRARLPRLGKVLAIQPQVREVFQPPEVCETAVRDPLAAVKSQVPEPRQVFQTRPARVRSRRFWRPSAAVSARPFW
jgi:hypothetical protein